MSYSASRIQETAAKEKHLKSRLNTNDLLSCNLCSWRSSPRYRFGNFRGACVLTFSLDQVRVRDWHVLLCKPNQNHIAARHLKRMPVDVFMPYHTANVRQGGRFRLQRRPLFAGYVFVGGARNRIPWRRIRTTPGVSQVIGLDARGPAQVPCDIIAGLVHRCDEEGMLQTEPDLTVGDRIKIMSGPFAEFVSRVEHIDADQRVHALLELLGAERRVAVDPRHIARLG